MSSGSSTKMRLISSSTVAVSSASASVLGSSGAKVGSLGVGAEHGVHVPRHLPEAPQAREEPLRRGLQLVERELPAVAAVAHVLLQHAERRVHRPAEVRVPAGELRDVLEVALGEEPQQLELRVDARLEPPEHLQDQLLVEDDRRVRLLGVITRADVSSVPRPAKPSSGRNSSIPSVGLHRDAAADHVHELAYVPRIGERVELLAARQQLVRLVRAGVEADLDERKAQLRLGVVQRRAVETRACVTSRVFDANQRCAVTKLDQLGLSWNQKNPLGASVSRYGRSPIGGKLVRPNISSGTSPANCDRSSSTACAERATLCTQSTMSSS